MPELIIDAEVNAPVKIALGELKRAPQVTYQLTCWSAAVTAAPSSFPARGNQWTTGGAGCSRWTGVRLKDVLAAAARSRLPSTRRTTGADQHLSGDPTKQTLSRGIRLEKAMEPHTLIVFAMNGEPLPAVHGAPLRLLVPGWSGSASQKWLNRIWIRDVEHDGQGMKGTSYRVPTVPIVPGSESKGEGFRVLESMPVRSVITSPADGSKPPAGTRELNVRGHAWAGDLTVKEVWLSIDFGQSWQPAKLEAPTNPFAWQHWTADVKLPTQGYYEIWARAVDSSGKEPTVRGGQLEPSGLRRQRVSPRRCAGGGVTARRLAAAVLVARYSGDEGRRPGGGRGADGVSGGRAPRRGFLLLHGLSLIAAGAQPGDDAGAVGHDADLDDRTPQHAPAGRRGSGEVSRLPDAGIRARHGHGSDARAVSDRAAAEEPIRAAVGRIAVPSHLLNQFTEMRTVAGVRDSGLAFCRGVGCRVAWTERSEIRAITWIIRVITGKFPHSLRFMRARSLCWTTWPPETINHRSRISPDRRSCAAEGYRPRSPEYPPHRWTTFPSARTRVSPS